MKSDWKDTKRIGGWSGRAKLAAKSIRPGQRVLDLGCWTMDLERHLPKGCVYLPCDLRKRDHRTLVCDFEKMELPDVQADVVVLLGVLEYLENAEEFLKALSRYSARIILTYLVLGIDQTRQSRLASEDIVRVLSDSGYGVSYRSSIGDQLYLVADLKRKRVKK